MAAVLARLHLSAIAGKQQLQYALRRPPVARLPRQRRDSPQPLLCTVPFLGSNCSSRRLKYNAAAEVSLGDKVTADHHTVVEALDDELGPEEHPGAGSSPPSSREYHSVARRRMIDGGGEKTKRPGRGGSKNGPLGWGEPRPGGGPHTD
ncbi:hypothetical protein E2562_000392 [Oryza meyeriana var. granulata]|uniref:Uncharacterized protein n=1 Tax=Oryza meyeriana var. granulata TaxID=110450 RepID=A0A6G1CD23_9ORYZ|nr:hypothetical protein E2562_000392 [Oryza meyeriana var. granulata]